MAKPTFDELVQLGATYANADIGISPYSGDNLIIANKIKDGINKAYRKITREKYRLIHKELVTLDSDSSFDTGSLSKTFYKIKEIKDSGEEQVAYQFEDTTTVKIHEISAGGSVYVQYEYIPAKLSTSTDVTDFPDGAFEEECLAYFGAFHYLMNENDTTANYWLGLFNEEFDNIRPFKGKSPTVKSRVRW